MKNLLIAGFFLLSVASCKKEDISQVIGSSRSMSSFQSDSSIQNQNEYVNNIKECLRQHLSREDYSDIDFSRIIATRFKRGRIYLVRIQFKKPSKEFVLVRTDDWVTVLKE